ncbi:MAG TPA: rhodanese-like domain-containing protein [Aromatoleum sp.]|uniref:MBL fold metallo-hydrolase n=1 Tax=Aromatoleum sp. TaxID=2307007 RepID=UPI002B48438C|nr:rhodanese-like domain-containing protein [Aromatoleum sp.]HJV24837.1 rhodanese-like domain-containing protein [Aromatoleum sp.]
MILEQFRAGGCLSYLVGCEQRCGALLIDPEISLVDRYLASCSHHGLQIHYLYDTHTHADHFSASRTLARRLEVPVVMHRLSPAPYVDIRVDDGEALIVGNLRLQILHTPGHTVDSTCVRVEDCLFSGDTLLIGATGRTDLPTGDPVALYHSLFDRLLKLPPETRVFPAHNYRDQESTTIGTELATNPRLQVGDRDAFVALMNSLDLKAPDHLTEALRVNCSGGQSVAQLIAEAADRIAFMSIDEVSARALAPEPGITILDVRETEDYRRAHIPGALHIPRGQLELRVDGILPDPTRRIVVYCEYGKISTLATAMLRRLGFSRAVALDGGFRNWREASLPVEGEGAGG